MRAEIENVVLIYQDEDSQRHTQPLADVPEVGPMTDEDGTVMLLIGVTIDGGKAAANTVWLHYDNADTQALIDLPESGCLFDVNAGDLEMTHVTY